MYVHMYCIYIYIYIYLYVCMCIYIYREISYRMCVHVRRRQAAALPLFFWRRLGRCVCSNVQGFGGRPTPYAQRKACRCWQPHDVHGNPQYPYPIS